jgi:hypothetical protein
MPFNCEPPARGSLPTVSAATIEMRQNVRRSIWGLDVYLPFRSSNSEVMTCMRL